MKDMKPRQIDSPDVVDDIAKEIGKQVASHLLEMYPEATEVVAWKSCSLSIEGLIRNQISSAGKAAETGRIQEWLKAMKQTRIAATKRARERL